MDVCHDVCPHLVGRRKTYCGDLTVHNDQPLTHPLPHFECSFEATAACSASVVSPGNCGVLLKNSGKFSQHSCQNCCSPQLVLAVIVLPARILLELRDW